MGRLRTAQRGNALAAAGTYKTVSTEAALLISGIIPIDLVAKERATIWRLERTREEEPENWSELEGAKEVDDRAVIAARHPAKDGIEVETETERKSALGCNTIYID